jgi:S1-C subfamily serine protease
MQIRTASTVYGTGFLVSNEGVVITALHVLRDVERREPGAQPLIGVPSSTAEDAASVRTNCKQFDLIGADEGHDLAVLLPRNRPIIREESSGVMTPCSAVTFSLDPLRDGIAIATSGYSIGNSTLMTSTGCIGTTRLHDSQVPNGANWYLAAMHIVSGNSGGPVYRVEDGKVIGVCKGYGARPVRDENREP